MFHTILLQQVLYRFWYLLASVNGRFPLGLVTWRKILDCILSNFYYIVRLQIPLKSPHEHVCFSRQFYLGSERQGSVEVLPGCATTQRELYDRGIPGPKQDEKNKMVTPFFRPLSPFPSFSIGDKSFSYQSQTTAALQLLPVLV